MARWKKPKRVKIKRKLDPPELACSLCDGAITQEEHDTVVRFFMTARPVLMPGWEALVAAAEDKTVMPVVWGACLAAACPTCVPELNAYMAIIDALMGEEEMAEEVMAARPLTWTQAEAMLVSDNAGEPHHFAIPEGRWRKDVFAEEDVA